jgi:hypothetical protein
MIFNQIVIWLPVLSIRKQKRFVTRRAYFKNEIAYPKTN